VTQPKQATSDESQRFLSLLDGQVRLGPRTIHVDVTNTCNTDCVTCWDHSPHLQEARPRSWKVQRADVPRLIEVVDDVRSLGGLRNVIVSGMGEPFTHPDIYDLLQALKARQLHVTVITNLVAADVDKIIAIGVDALLIGVQGASEQSYLAFHPSFQSLHWHKLHTQLRALQHSRVQCKHVQVICAHNAHELSAMVELAHQHAAHQVNFKLASLKHGTEVVGLSAPQRAHTLQHDVPQAMQTALRLGMHTNLPVLAAQLRTGDDETAPIDEVGCLIGHDYSRITVDGTVLYCCNTDVVVGSLQQHSFSTLWRGEVWQRWRARMQAGHYLPSCFQCGKLNQNVDLSQRFRAQHGDAAWWRVTGRDDQGRPRRPRRAAKALPVMP
jgi:MoaA/NifB/PqqE/SkfB family radical SAM enzyme